MGNDVQKLIDLTTIVKVEDNENGKVIYGDEYYVSKFQKGPENQIDLATSVPHWNNKWKSFGNAWSKKRQDYRFLYDSFKLFYYSFEQLRVNKVKAIETVEDNDKLLYFNQLSGVSLYGVYHHGKKSIDLLKKLNLIDSNHQSFLFYEKFRETRNKLIEHNFNPSGLKLLIEPCIWSLTSTTSLIEIRIHDKTENSYTVYIDYYEDYYNLEKIITDIIKSF